MKFITDKIEWTSAMQERAVSDLDLALARLSENVDNAIIKISKLGDDNIKVGININSYRVQAIHSDFYIAMHKAAMKLKNLIIKNMKKEKSQLKLHQLSLADLGVNLEIDNSEDNLVGVITKEKHFDLKPMSLDEAINEFELTDYEFFVFRDSSSDVINIIYKRFNKSYGLIICE